MGSVKYLHKLSEAPCVPKQVTTGTTCAELWPAKYNLGSAAERPAEDNGAQPADQMSPASGPSSTADSSSPKALPGTPPPADARQLEGRQAEKEKGSGKNKKRGSSGEQPLTVDYDAAAAAAQAQLLSRWNAHLTARKAVSEASQGAAPRAAQLDAAARERVRAARLQSYPLPLRIAAPYMRATAGALWCAVRAQEAAGERVHNGFLPTLAEANPVHESYGRLLWGAHAAGLHWLAWLDWPTVEGNGLGVAAAQAWFAQFLELCAGVRGARALFVERRNGALRHMGGISDALKGVFGELTGGGRGSSSGMCWYLL